MMPAPSREKRREARWARQQARLERHGPPRKSRLGEMGTSRGECIDAGCIDAGWKIPPPVLLPDGSAVRLFKDGQGLTAALQAIEAAREQILLEVYIFHSDDTGRAFADALAEKAASGVRVFLIYDSFGSFDSDPAMFKQMRQAGVHLAEFHPIHPWDCNYPWQPLSRDHRKLLVVDDTVAVFGGMNVGSEYGSGFLSPRPRKYEVWRDNAVSVAGPGTAVFSECFSRTWRYVKRGGTIRTAEMAHQIDIGPIRRGHVGRHQGLSRATESSVSPAPKPRLLGNLGLLASVPTASSPLGPFLRNLVRSARYSLDATIAYFAPSDALAHELVRAACRGVNVRLMLPGRSDVPLTRTAAHSFYEPLLNAGVEIWERQGAVLHAKTMVIDEQTSLVGSTNLDYRSIEFNCELSAVIRSRPFGRQMTALFQHDMDFAKQILLAEWRRRPLRDKVVQWAAGKLKHLL
jgi:cardiolipin synthase